MNFVVVRVALVVFLLAGCASRPPVSPETPLAFDEAVVVATDQLVAQVSTMPAFLALGTRGIVHDPTLGAGSGQQTGATQRLDGAIAARIAGQHTAFEILPFRPAHLAQAKYLLASTMARDASALVPAQRIELALVEIDGGAVVARATIRALDAGLDHAPLPYYRDSPVLVKDRVVDGYIATATTARGQRGDAFYLERITVASVVNEATELYNQARYREALGEYRSALAGSAGEQLRVLNGIYLANARLGNAAEAEAAFGRVVAMGIAYRQLSVKFLFNPGTIAFWVDPRINTPYPMWLRQIARESTQARACMDIVGHTSKSGNAAVNEALSLRRAAEIRRRLVAESPALSKRTNIVGVGFRETLIGSGTDDALDVLDRRVEFRVIPCEDVASR